MSTVGENIKKRRKELGLSAERLADIIGIAPATIYRYENGSIEKLGTDKLVPIAKALKTTPADLLMGIDDQEEYKHETTLTDNDIDAIAQRVISYQSPYNDAPKTPEAKILARGIDKLPKEQRELALNVMKAMFVKYEKFFEEGEEKHDET